MYALDSRFVSQPANLRCIHPQVLCATGQQCFVCWLYGPALSELAPIPLWGGAVDAAPFLHPPRTPLRRVGIEVGYAVALKASCSNVEERRLSFSDRPLSILNERLGWCIMVLRVYTVRAQTSVLDVQIIWK